MRFIKQFVPALATLTATLVGVASAVYHDEHFVPEAVLRVTEVSAKQSCVPTKDILLVNGTSPGPALVFKEGATIWIRVYNDIPHQNLTMVRSYHFLCTRWHPLPIPSVIVFYRCLYAHQLESLEARWRLNFHLD